MIAAARYLLTDHLRSRRIAGPLLVLLAGVIVLYATPLPPGRSGPRAVETILSNAGTVAAFLFPAQAWLTQSLFNAQGTADRHTLIAAIGPRRFAFARLLAAAAWCVAASVIALVWPLIAGAVPRTPTLTETSLILAGNLLATIAGSALGALFSAPVTRSRAVAVLGIVAVVLFTIPTELPPLVPTARAFDTDDAATVPRRAATDALGVAIFTGITIVACARLWRRRE